MILIDTNYSSQIKIKFINIQQQIKSIQVKKNQYEEFKDSKGRGHHSDLPALVQLGKKLNHFYQ